MNLEYLIIPGVVIVGLGGGLFLIKESRKYRLRRDKAKAIQLHQELSALSKAIESASGTDAGAEGVKQTAPARCL